MTYRVAIVVGVLSCWLASAAAAAPLEPAVAHELPSLLAFYKKLHAAPELSHFETATSAAVAGQLRW